MPLKKSARSRYRNNDIGLAQMSSKLIVKPMTTAALENTLSAPLYVGLMFNYPCGCKSFHVLLLSDYCSTPELAVEEVTLVGIYQSAGAAMAAADKARAIANAVPPIHDKTGGFQHERRKELF